MLKITTNLPNNFHPVLNDEQSRTENKVQNFIRERYLHKSFRAKIVMLFQNIATSMVIFFLICG